MFVSCIAGFLFVTATFLYRGEARKAVPALLLAVTLAMAGALAAIYLYRTYRHFIYPGPMGTKEVHEHPSVLRALAITYWLTAWLTTVIFSRMRRWAMKEKFIQIEW